jgi:signal peptidase I
MRRKQVQQVSVSELEAELRRTQRKHTYRSTLMSTISSLVIVAAIAVLVSMLWLPVLQVVGESMTPSLSEGEIVISPKGTTFEKGDVIAFYFNNKILIKRVIANAGEWVDIDESGNVYVNNVLLDEPYVSEKAFGDCNIKLPYQVPDGKTFVMGDHRATSADSRNTAVGCVAEEQVVGKVLLRLWPFNRIGVIE